MIGVSSGYLEDEFRAFGLDVRQRGSMTHEYLAAMKELWSNQVASFHGRYTNFDNMTISVRPAQEPHPPILYGSHGPIPWQHIARSYQGVIGSTGTTSAFEDEMVDLMRLWKENGRLGKPYVQSGIRAHLTTSREEAGEKIVKGVVPPGQDVPTVRPERVTEGERVYMSTYSMKHVDDLLEDMRRQEVMGVDLINFWLPSYAFKGKANLELQLEQMDLLAEHILSKFPRDTSPIGMDFGGNLYQPLNLS